MGWGGVAGFWGFGSQGSQGVGGIWRRVDGGVGLRVEVARSERPPQPLAARLAAGALAEGILKPLGLNFAKVTSPEEFAPIHFASWN